MKLSRTAILLGVLAAAHLAFSLFVNPAGYLTYDSGTYHLMVDNFAETGSFFIRNGFEEYPSPELRVAQLRISGGHLASQYPEFQTLLGLPFYLAFGYQGLLLLNALCFLGINALIFRLARLLFDSSQIGYVSMAVYSLATYAWEYSHSSYPHLSSTLFILAAYTFLTRALVGRSSSGPSVDDAERFCFLAGLVTGLAVGLRLDAAFAIPGLFVPLVLRRPLRFAPLAALAAGLAPGLLFLAAANLVKFDTFNPLSYGRTTPATYLRSASSDLTSTVKLYLPIFALAVLATVLVLVLHRLPARHRARGGWAFAAGAVAVAAIFPALTWQILSDLVHGTYQIVVDMRVRSLDIPEPALFRTHSGAMVYIGGVKKSLLQSCSYLVLLPFLAFGDWRWPVKRLAFLAIVPASFVGYYGYLAWHGSIALNMRYLNPILPFTSILTALAWSRLEKHVSPRRAALYGGGLLAALFLLFWRLPLPLRQQELWFLTVPLVLALALLLLETARRLKWTPTLGGPLVGYLLVASFAWSGAMAFGRDYPASARLRDANVRMGRLFRDGPQGPVGRTETDAGLDSRTRL